LTTRIECSPQQDNQLPGRPREELDRSELCHPIPGHRRQARRPHLGK